jgi:wyosine [tRNA(Phe)-imidazoG37] synthetase (radical SAM superfamily)
MSKLSVKNHDRDVAGYQYIYPVVSRRSGGLSIGINFNTNNACNWGCVYCQVPDLSIGTAPELDFKLLRKELAEFLKDVLHGTFYERFQLEPEMRVIKDIAISGNGEPTSVKDFSQAIAVITEQVEQAGISEPFQYVLITNGSLLHKADVQAGLRLFNQYHGQIWFKVDSVTELGRANINHAAISRHKQRENLLMSAKLCSTWLQTCVLKFVSNTDVYGLLEEQEQTAYLDFLRTIITEVSLRGVMLYGLARASLQPEANYITSANMSQLHAFADRIRQVGVNVKVSL